MGTNIVQEISALGRMTTKELRSRYLEVCGEPTRSGNRDWLRKRVAWRIQANAWGDLPCRAKRRAEELANDANLRTTAPKAMKDNGQPASAVTATVAVAFEHDPRLPMPGAILRRQYKDRDIVVRVMHRGFEWEGQVYRSLSAVAKAVTGTHWSGYHFFNLKQNGDTDE